MLNVVQMSLVVLMILFFQKNQKILKEIVQLAVMQNVYMVVVNAGMGGKIAQHMTAQKGARAVEIVDLTDKLGKMDIQGPAAAKILMKVLQAPVEVLEKMPYFSFKGHFDKTTPLSEAVRYSDGTPILLSRTGYTGEFGFEIFVDSENLVKLWEMTLAAGEDLGMVPCGLAARDSLRAGAVLPLSHQSYLS